MAKAKIRPDNILRVAYGLSDKNDERQTRRQASTLLYCLGADAEDVLLTTNITTKHLKKYQKVLEKFAGRIFYCTWEEMLFYERAIARFNKRTQQQGELAEDYITDLHQWVRKP